MPRFTHQTNQGRMPTARPPRSQCPAGLPEQAPPAAPAGGNMGKHWQKAAVNNLLHYPSAITSKAAGQGSQSRTAARQAQHAPHCRQAGSSYTPGSAAGQSRPASLWTGSPAPAAHTPEPGHTRWPHGCRRWRRRRQQGVLPAAPAPALNNVAGVTADAGNSLVFRRRFSRCTCEQSTTTGMYAARRLCGIASSGRIKAGECAPPHHTQPTWQACSSSSAIARSTSGGSASNAGCPPARSRARTMAACLPLAANDGPGRCSSSCT